MSERREASPERLPAQSEREWQATILEYANLMGWRAWHDNATNAPRRCVDCGSVRRLPRNASGLPDLILVRRPRVIFAELKSETGRLSDAQRDWLDALAGCPVESYVWRPSQWSDVERVLR